MQEIIMKTILRENPRNSLDASEVKVTINWSFLGVMLILEPISTSAVEQKEYNSAFSISQES